MEDEIRSSRPPGETIESVVVPLLFGQFISS
jgi:hypothetical protein